MTEWLDISDRFVMCQCIMPRTDFEADDEGRSQERPHGMDKSDLHKPSDFIKAQTRWNETQRFTRGSALYKNLASRILPAIEDFPGEDNALSNFGVQPSPTGQVTDELEAGGSIGQPYPGNTSAQSRSQAGRSEPGLIPTNAKIKHLEIMIPDSENS
ncbi:unnamed protein product [Allacma fusca]|uniref:Uncharacterized protein n=1 Tax=Allacma fusca TaxID=39272 RepID=A0A8J2KNI9_9HEXA|nr:unnamed protein product [Allacma fusca]